MIAGFGADHLIPLKPLSRDTEVIDLPHHLEWFLEHAVKHLLQGHNFLQTSTSYLAHPNHGCGKIKCHLQALNPYWHWSLLNVGSNPSKGNIHMLTTTPSTSKNPDDVVITLAIRTPLTKAGKGGFKDTQLDYIMYALLQKVLERSKIDPAIVEDICCGNVSITPSATAQ